MWIAAELVMSTMLTSDPPFADWRELLRNLDFAAKAMPTPAVVFERAGSGTLFVFRAYRSKDKVSLADLVSVRAQLDERGLRPIHGSYLPVYERHDPVTIGATPVAWCGKC